MTNDTDELRILTLNIGSPSTARAERQLAWIEGRQDDILVLTETSDAAGSRLVAARLTAAGWDVRSPALAERERGVMVASRLRAHERAGDIVTYLPARAQGLVVSIAGIEIIGVYVPSRDESTLKVQRKQRFVRELQHVLAERRGTRSVLIGDLNVLEPDHIPRYTFFRDWEYALYTGLIDDDWIDAYRDKRHGTIEHSWVGHDNDGFRYDHVFVTPALRDSVLACEMLHHTREAGLTDHSALSLTLSCSGVERLDVESSLSGEPAALF